MSLYFNNIKPYFFKETQGDCIKVVKNVQCIDVEIPSDTTILTKITPCYEESGRIKCPCYNNTVGFVVMTERDIVLADMKYPGECASLVLIPPKDCAESRPIDGKNTIFDFSVGLRYTTDSSLSDYYIVVRDLDEARSRVHDDYLVKANEIEPISTECYDVMGWNKPNCGHDHFWDDVVFWQDRIARDTIFIKE